MKTVKFCEQFISTLFFLKFSLSIVEYCIRGWREIWVHNERADQQRGAEGDAFLDPRPLNLTLCQSQSQDRFRHSKVEFWESDKTKIDSYNWTFQGCKPLVENYVSQELVIIVGMSLGPSVANVIVLSVTAFFWRNIITK